MTDTRIYRTGDDTNPAHYRDGRGECIDAMPDHFAQWLARTPRGEWIQQNTRIAVRLMMLGFCVGNAFKYRWRAGQKGDAAKDEAKAQWYDRFAAYVLDSSAGDPRDVREP